MRRSPLHDYFPLPESIRSGVKRYIEKGVRPAGFLAALIENNLRQAIGRADAATLAALPDIVKWFYNVAPEECWGSPGRMEVWIALFKEPKQ